MVHYNNISLEGVIRVLHKYLFTETIIVRLVQLESTPIYFTYGTIAIEELKEYLKKVSGKKIMKSLPVFPRPKCVSNGSTRAKRLPLRIHGKSINFSK